MTIVDKHNVRDQAAEEEPALERTALEVQEARTAIRRFIAGQNGGQAWTFGEIQERITSWSSTLVSLALLGMLEDGELDVLGNLQVRLSQAKT